MGPLTFAVPQGRITALDGASGSGKSTVLGVLAGTVGAGAGTTITGSLTGLDRSAVAWVPQHPVMVAETVLDEVLLYLGAVDAQAGPMIRQGPTRPTRRRPAGKRRPWSG